MIYDVITLFPNIIKSYCLESITKRGIEKNIIKVNTINPRDFSKDKHKRVDDTPYGGGDGMVLTCQPIFDCYRSIEKKENFEFIMLTPQGERFSQNTAIELSKKEQLILLCGHYEGFDERIRIGLKPREISIGDYILTGGELAALVLIDSISRNLENYLGKENSAKIDSFSPYLNGALEYPQYTKPRIFEGMPVPDILLSGNHKEIQTYRTLQSLQKTQSKRPDLM